MTTSETSWDDIVIGAGHNGLTAAAYLARAGRRVLVLERLDHVGGAAVSAPAFAGVDARLSRYSYLVSLLPQQVVRDLDLDLRLVRRRYSSYTPLPSDPRRGLLVDTGDPEATRASFVAVTGDDRDFVAWERFYGRMGALAGRIWPTVLEPLRSAAELRALVGDDDLWDALTTRPLGELLRATFDDDLVRGVVATDGLIGTFADLDDPSLAQNTCFLYHLVGGGTGDWDVPVGGMGAVSGALARAASAAGATIVTGAEVTAVSADGEVSWTHDGRTRTSRGQVVVGLAPAVLDILLAATGAEPVSTGQEPEGAQLKVNMMLSRLPRPADPAIDPVAAFSGTFHVAETFAQLQDAYAVAASGSVPPGGPCEIYCHTLSDRSILGPELAASDAQTLTLFGVHFPTRIFSSDNETRRAEALRAVMSALDGVLGEPLEPLLLRDRDGRPALEVRSPLDLEADLGLPGGNIFHRPLQWPWAEQPHEVGLWGGETRHPRITLAGAGARRGGGVSGIAGHNAARVVLQASGS
ncbi:MAG: NAD(P)/FAD-dependent oxidoreductase [Actinomycetota bacterium]|nr:NAD(P)/FAD-dependent oxidoreductase [Actinomycetota bacterium]